MFPPTLVPHKNLVRNRFAYIYIYIYTCTCERISPVEIMPQIEALN